MSRKLVLAENDKMIAGVCGGIAQKLGFKSKVVRIAFILFSVFFGSGILLYLILWVLMSKSDSSY